MKSFGAGCFHFSLKEGERKHTTIKEYIQEIGVSIEKIDTISKVKIKFDETTESQIIEIPDHPPKIRNGNECHPHIDFLEIEFEIYIPFRIQENIINSKYIETRTERFKVYMRHDWHGPVSYIECINPSDIPKPSEAVRIVREYLAKELNNSSELIEFDFIGPSPFHADFYLIEGVPSNEKNRQFKIQHEASVAYDTITFSTDQKLDNHENEILKQLFDEIDDELGFFYFINTTQIHRSSMWAEISRSTQSILNIEDKTNKSTLWQRSIEKPKLINETMSKIGIFKGQEIFTSSIIKNAYTAIYDNPASPQYLKFAIDQELKEKIDLPITETKDLLSFIDSKGSKKFELAVLFSASVVGGLTGALITWSLAGQ